MAADKDIRLVRIKHSHNINRILSRMPADMRHKHFCSLAVEQLNRRILQPHQRRIAVAAHPNQRLELAHLVGKILSPAKIPRMPDLIHRRKEFFEFLMLVAGTAFAASHKPRKNSRTEMGIHGNALYVIGVLPHLCLDSPLGIAH